MATSMPASTANCWPGGSVIATCETGRGGEGLRFQITRLATTAPKRKTPKLRITARRPGLRIPSTATAGAFVICEPASAIHLNSSHKSLAVYQRFSGSFARHLLTVRSSAGGVIGLIEEISGGSSFKIAPITLAWLLPSNAFMPLAIS